MAKKTTSTKTAKSKAATATKPKATKAAPKPVPKASKTPSNGKTSTPTVKTILAELESLSDPKVHAHNAKYGAGKNQFGVKMGDIRKVANKLKTNHALALELWKTGNVDARLLATLLMKPGELSSAEMQKLVRSVDFVHVAEWLHSYVLKEHADKESLRQKWMTSTDRWEARAAWRLTAGRVVKSPEGIDVVSLLDRIEREMGGAKPEVQWTMNECLAQIGITNPKLRPRAIAIGEKLGIFVGSPGTELEFAL